MTSNPPPFLESVEIHSMTNKVRHQAQTHVLRNMGIEHKVRPDGSIAIMRAHINNVFGGNAVSPTRTTKNTEVAPNWAAI